ncbi:MAG: hypothetical protein ABSF76_06330 [Opitutaceae bacterium]|jgi:hypothetical protein
MIPSLDKRRIASIAIAAAATLAALWLYATQPRAGRHGQPFVPIQDGKTLDFSGGSPVIRDSAADKAALDKAVKEMDEASKSVTFPADPPQKK